MSSIRTKAQIKLDERRRKYDPVKNSYKTILKILMSTAKKYPIHLSGNKVIYKNELDMIDDIFEKILQYNIGKNSLYRIIGFLKVNKNTNKPKQYLISKIFENPYKMLTEYVQFISFKKCERIEMEENLPVTYNDKIASWLCYVFYDQLNSFYVSYGEIVKYFQEKFPCNISELEKKITNIYIHPSTKEKIENTPGAMRYVTTNHYINMEKSLGDLFIDKFYQEEEYDYDVKHINKFIQKMEIKMNRTLNPEQKQAIIFGIKNKFSIISGPPGAGKSTILEIIISYLISVKHIHAKSTFNLAPTGLAAKNLKDCKGEYMTIHKYIYQCKNEKNKEEELESGCESDTTSELGEVDSVYESDTTSEDFSENNYINMINIDESSMIATRLFVDFMDAIKDKDCRLIMIGDTNQLPPIGPGKPFHDIIKSGIFKMTNLKEIVRSQDAPIVKNAIMKMTNGYIGRNDFDGVSMKFIETNDFSKKFLYNILNNGVHNKDNTKILWSMNDKDYLTSELKGKDSTNDFLQMRWNMEYATSYQFQNNKQIKLGDIIIRKVNDYNGEMPHVNGDVAVVDNIDHVKREILVQYNTGENGKIDKEVVDFYEFSELFDLFYASTVHKMQGSEVDHVVIIIHTHQKMKWGKQMLYTAMSRAKKSITILGSFTDFMFAQRNDDDFHFSYFMKEFTDYEF